MILLHIFAVFVFVRLYTYDFSFHVLFRFFFLYYLHVHGLEIFSKKKKKTNLSIANKAVEKGFWVYLRLVNVANRSRPTFSGMYWQLPAVPVLTLSRLASPRLI